MPIHAIAEQYAAKSDEELLQLACGRGDLTEEAQCVLSEELAKRGLVQPEEKPVTVKPSPTLEFLKAAVGDAMEPRRHPWLQSQYFWYPVHLLLLYFVALFCTPRLAYWTRDYVVPLFDSANTTSRLSFLFSHLLVFSFVPAFLVGLLNSRLRHAAMKYVWIVPAVLLAFKLLMYRTPPKSVLGILTSDTDFSAFRYFFGGNFDVPDFRDWHEFWKVVVPNPDYVRGMTQIYITGPFYVGVGYGLSAFIGVRTGLSEAIERRLASWKKPTPTEGA